MPIRWVHRRIRGIIFGNHNKDDYQKIKYWNCLLYLVILVEAEILMQEVFVR